MKSSRGLKHFFNRVCVRVTGFKPGRVGQWVQVLRIEGRRHGIVTVARQIAVEALSHLRDTDVAGRAKWRAGMRSCAGCPVYNRATKACRDPMGQGTGCGCFMPIKRLAGGQTCWLAAIRLHE